MIWLSKQQILKLHADLIESYGGTTELRDEGVLDSAIAAPFQTFDDKELFPTIVAKATRLGYALTVFHPFVDGNKRIGAHAMLVVLALNDIELTYTQKELSDTILSLAAGKIEYDKLLEWVTAHILKK